MILPDEANPKFCMEMELCVMNLYDYARQYEPRISTRRRYLKEMLEALAFIHSQGVLHRDIKPENILLTHNRQIKLADFGLSRFYHVPLRQYTMNVASRWWRAPELMLGEFKYGPAIDVWSMALIFVEVVTGRSPWRKTTWTSCFIFFETWAFQNTKAPFWAGSFGISRLARPSDLSLGPGSVARRMPPAVSNARNRPAPTDSRGRRPEASFLLGIRAVSHAQEESKTRPIVQSSPRTDHILVFATVLASSNHVLSLPARAAMVVRQSKRIVVFCRFQGKRRQRRSFSSGCCRRIC